MTTQLRVDISKETHHDRRKQIHHAEDREGNLLRNLRLCILFLRVPGKCLSLRTKQLPMWLPHANRRTVGRLCPARRTVAGGAQIATGRVMRVGIVRISPLAYHA